MQVAEGAIRSIEFDPGKSYLLLVDREQVGLKDIAQAVMDLPAGTKVFLTSFRRVEGEPVVSMDNLKLIRQWLEGQEALCNR